MSKERKKPGGKESAADFGKPENGGIAGQRPCASRHKRNAETKRVPAHLRHDRNRTRQDREHQRYDAKAFRRGRWTTVCRHDREMRARGEVTGVTPEDEHGGLGTCAEAYDGLGDHASRLRPKCVQVSRILN